MIRVTNRIALLVLTLTLGACAQGRKGLGSDAGNVELWEPQSLCANTPGVDTMACVDIQLNITDNLAYVDVTSLKFDPAAVPYRMYARRSQDSTFVMLAENITAPAGSSFEIHPLKNHYIEEYEEWVIDLSTSFDTNGFEMQASPLQGIIAARSIIYWPELDGVQ